MKNAATSGWDQLLCPYFANVTKGVLVPTLSRDGFIEAESSMLGEPVFRNRDMFTYVGYVPETYPSYSPTVIFGRGGYDIDSNTNMVPAWFVIPNDEDARKYSLWTFNSAAQLALVLNNLLTCVYEPYIKPLLTNPRSLDAALQQFRARNAN